MRGKLAILVILGLACGATSFAIWYNHKKTRRIIRFFGPSPTVLIARAPDVKFLQLAPTTDAGDEVDQEILAAGEQELVVLNRHEISEARGLKHLRHALRQDVSYAWEDSAKPNSEWPYALQFIHGPRRETLLLHPDSSPFIPVAVMADLQRKLPNAALQVFPDTRHGLPFSHAEECARALRRFLEQM